MRLHSLICDTFKRYCLDRRKLPAVRYQTHCEKFLCTENSGLQSAHFKPKDQMSTQTSKPRFKHNPVRGMPERVESFCLRCGQFVGASDNPRSLKIAEKAHLCPESNGLKGLNYSPGAWPSEQEIAAQCANRPLASSL